MTSSCNTFYIRIYCCNEKSCWLFQDNSWTVWLQQGEWHCHTLPAGLLIHLQMWCVLHAESPKFAQVQHDHLAGHPGKTRNSDSFRGAIHKSLILSRERFEHLHLKPKLIQQIPAVESFFDRVFFNAWERSKTFERPMMNKNNMPFAKLNGLFSTYQWWDYRILSACKLMAGIVVVCCLYLPTSVSIKFVQEVSRNEHDKPAPTHDLQVDLAKHPHAIHMALSVA